MCLTNVVNPNNRIINAKNNNNNATPALIIGAHVSAKNASESFDDTQFKWSFKKP